MFEAMTYESILDDMLDRVTSDVDKREGSVIFDALAPCAYHLAQTYYYLDAFVDLVSGDTAIGEYLDKVVADYGLTRKSATYAVRKITTSGSVDIGTRWGIEDLAYDITALLDTNVYSAICETAGEVGGTYSGSMESIDNTSGITAILGDIITEGEDEESDDDLRERFFNQVQSTSTSGNAADYKKWALSVSGVGGAKVFPLWNGNGTVKVVIVDSEKQPVTNTLVVTTAAYIETVRPIGATVTVVSGAAKAINISATITMAAGYTLSAVTSAFTSSVMSYFQDISFDLTYVSLAKIGTILLGIDGVVDYSDLQLNSSTSNITLGDEEIPVIGTVDLGV